jgi:hypothetical protein
MHAFNNTTVLHIQTGHNADLFDICFHDSEIS